MRYDAVFLLLVRARQNELLELPDGYPRQRFNFTLWRRCIVYLSHLHGIDPLKLVLNHFSTRDLNIHAVYEKQMQIFWLYRKSQFFGSFANGS